MTEFPKLPVIGPRPASVFSGVSTDDVQGQIGLRLRAVYETIVSEPVPDRFKALLETLDCSNQRKV
jgi:hypothetical protein